MLGNVIADTILSGTEQFHCSTKSMLTFLTIAAR